MYSADVAMGLGSLVYALSKLDGPIHPQELHTIKKLLSGEPHGDLALYAYFIRENTGELSEDAYAFGIRRMAAQQIELTPATKQRFVNILRRVALAHEGISRQERRFIDQFWREINKQ